VSATLLPLPEGADPTQAPYDSWPYVDRRETMDRRRQPTRWWESLRGYRQRKRGRRAGEAQNIYVDRFHVRDIVLVLAVFLLNILDAALTLKHLGEGGSEANPVAAALLTNGDASFVYEKCFGVALCLLALTIHKTFFMARVGLYLLLGAYGLLSLYHLWFLLGFGG
jgi:hypothetical protein